MSMKTGPAFLITIDTEGDNLWAKPREITTRNAKSLPRFQRLCERYGFKPTYLTNYEMAMDDFFVDFARDAIGRGTAEIGMHLHAWNSPPIAPLTPDDFTHHPYLIEYSDALMEEKIAFMTDLLEDRFRIKMVSHRAGRWALDERYARLLVARGYTVDCSVTPGISWARQMGAPNGKGGSDYRRFPEDAYFLNLEDISSRGHSHLLELPMTISRPFLYRAAMRLGGTDHMSRLMNRLTAHPRWFRPNSTNLAEMQQIVRKTIERRRPYIEFMLHSSEFMPFGSPTFPNRKSVETLYAHLEIVFEQASASCSGATLAEFRQQFHTKDLPSGTSS